MYLPGECYIDVFLALLGVILFNIMTGGTVNEHSAPSGCYINALNRPKPPGRKRSSERGSLPDYRE